MQDRRSRRRSARRKSGHQTHRESRSGPHAAHASDLSPISSWITSMPISIANSAADWLFASFWKDFPDLKIALSEGSIGWVPYFLERAETTVRQHSAWTNLNLGGRTDRKSTRMNSSH